MIVLDASLLIAHLDSTDPHHDAAQSLLLDSAAEGFAASVVTIAEVLVAPARVHRLAEAESALVDLGVEAVPLAVDAPARLAQLRVDAGLRMPDCCVLLAAQDCGRTLATFDGRQAAQARGLGLQVLPNDGF